MRSGAEMLSFQMVESAGRGRFRSVDMGIFLRREMFPRALWFYGGSSFPALPRFMPMRVVMARAPPIGARPEKAIWPTRRPPDLTFVRGASRT